MQLWQPRHTRLLLILMALLSAAFAVALTLRALEQKVTYFYTPSDIKSREQGLLETQKNIRLGGLVVKGSIRHGGQDGLELGFTVTDLKRTLKVRYHGIPPDLFRDGQGVVAEGHLIKPSLFEAHTLLAKHDETYMPPDVARGLKRVNRNQGSGIRK
jgi:cytochrome c-type biogenesis protein CcmE